MIEKLKLICARARRNTRIKDTLKERRELLINLLLDEEEFSDGRIILPEGERRCKGAVYSITELKDRYRINYRCGYTRHNYAPCIEILKD